MRDKLIEMIFSSIRGEKVDAREKMNAIVRAGQIANAYLGAPDVLLESVFGPDGALQHDLRPHHASSHH